MLYFGDDDAVNRINLGGADCTTHRGLAYAGTLFDRVCPCGANPLIEKTQGRSSTVTYRYEGEGMSVDVCFFGAQPLFYRHAGCV